MVCTAGQIDDAPSWWDGLDCLMAIDLGYDESGSGDTLLVSMQLGVTDQAKKLRRKWKGKLRAADVEYFHAKEFDNFSHGVFAGLDRHERIKLLRELSRLAVQHLSIGITAKVTKSIYEQKTTPAFRSRWGTAYTFAIQMLVVSGYLFAKHSRLRPEFNILIEDGHRHAGQAIKTLHDTKKAGLDFEVPSRLLSIGLGSKSDHPILQAADMLAYSEWQQMTGGDPTIYNALHPRASSYRTEFVDFDVEMVDVVMEGAEKWVAARKAFGQQRAKQIEQGSL